MTPIQVIFWGGVIIFGITGIFCLAIDFWPRKAWPKYIEVKATTIASLRARADALKRVADSLPTPYQALVRLGRHFTDRAEALAPAFQYDAIYFADTASHCLGHVEILVRFSKVTKLNWTAELAKSMEFIAQGKWAHAVVVLDEMEGLAW